MTNGGPSEFPTWARTLGTMIAGNCRVRVGCTRCGRWDDVDVVALAAKAGLEYSLIDRRCRCRLTPGCKGWNSFSYLLGVYRPLTRPETGLRRMLRHDP